MTEREDRFQTSVIFEGHVADTDRELLSSLMGRMGLKFTFEENPLPSTSEQALNQQAELIAEHGYRFSDITSPHHILLKEHIEDLVTQSPEYSKNTYTRAFSKLFDLEGATETLIRWQPGIGNVQVREPMPMPGVMVVARDTQKLGRYKGSPRDGYGHLLASRYGIIAGTLVEAFGDTLDQPHRKSGPQADKCVKDIVNWLRFQFVTTDDVQN